MLLGTKKPTRTWEAASFTCLCIHTWRALC